MPCGDYIETVEECEAAAASLRLPGLKRSGEVYKKAQGGVDSAKNPYGCYVTTSNSLNFNKNENNKNQILNSTRVPLCRVIKTASPTQSPSRKPTQSPIT